MYTVFCVADAGNNAGFVEYDGGRFILAYTSELKAEFAMGGNPELKVVGFELEELWKRIAMYKKNPFDKTPAYAGILIDFRIAASEEALRVGRQNNTSH